MKTKFNIKQILNMSTREIIYSILLITIGCVIYSCGINAFIIPNKFATGGIAGVSIIINYLTGIPTGNSNFVLNAILLVIGWHFLEKRTLIFTGYTLVVISIFLNIIHPAPFISDNILIAAAAGGILTGTGMGIIIIGNGTTAGSDIIAMIMKKYLGIGFAAGVMICDALVMIFSSFVIGVEKMIVTTILLFISTQVIAFLTEGLNRKKSMIIITDKPKEVSDVILAGINRGVTVLKGYGYYSKLEKEVLYIVVNSYQIMTAQRQILQIDSNAFISIIDTYQVIGQGFTFFNSDNKNKDFFLR
jgi:yitT family protein